MPDQSSAATEHAILQEITAPLERLPDDPLALVEVEFPTVMRGYDRHAVDEYVERTRRLVSELHSTRSPEAAVRKALERVGDQVAGILQRAHETSEQITARSRSEAEDRLEDARREAARLLEDAEQRVRELDADTDRIWAERQRIVADADDLSAQLSALSREAAQRFAEPEGPAAGLDEPPELEDGAQLGDELEQSATAEDLDDEDELDEREGGPVQARTEEPGVDRTAAFSPLKLRDDADAELTGAWDPTNPELDLPADDGEDRDDAPSDAASPG
jgi:DivIVA domain-containing protein